MRIGDLVSKLDEWFPPSLAEEWDNVGLLLGDHGAKVERVMTCLTVTKESAQEAILRESNLIVSHHPILFRGAKRLLAEGPHSAVYELARAGISVYSPHTAFDSALRGINEQIGLKLGIAHPRPMRITQDLADDRPAGTGRWGALGSPISLQRLAEHVGEVLRTEHVRYVGSPDWSISSVGIGCGAAGELLQDATALECDAFVTGEARFHDCLAAEAAGIALILTGHYASERFAVESLAERISHEWMDLDVWASRDERDPLHRV